MSEERYPEPINRLRRAMWACEAAAASKAANMKAPERVASAVAELAHATVVVSYADLKWLLDRELA